MTRGQAIATVLALVGWALFFAALEASFRYMRREARRAEGGPVIVVGYDAEGSAGHFAVSDDGGVTWRTVEPEASHG